MRVYPVIIVWLLAAWPASAQQEPAERDGHLYLARPDGSEMKQLPDPPGCINPGSPCWTADGRLLAFDAVRQGQQAGGGRQIVVMLADGTQPRALIDGAMPSFSPRGQRIAFSRYTPNRGVWVTSTEGPEKELVLL